MFPPGRPLIAVAAELYHEAATDGSDMRPSQAMMAEWTGYSERTVREAIAQLVAAGLLYRAFDASGAGRGKKTGGRAAVWELTMRIEHAELLEAAGFDLEWRGAEHGGARRYRHAAKKTGSLSFLPFAQAGGPEDD